MMLRLDDRSSPWSNFLRRFTKDRVGMISLIVVALLILTAVVGPGWSRTTPKTSSTTTT